MNRTSTKLGIILFFKSSEDSEGDHGHGFVFLLDGFDEISDLNLRGKKGIRFNTYENETFERYQLVYATVNERGNGKIFVRMLRTVFPGVITERKLYPLYGGKTTDLGNGEFNEKEGIYSFELYFKKGFQPYGNRFRSFQNELAITIGNEIQIQNIQLDTEISKEELELFFKRVDKSETAEDIKGVVNWALADLMNKEGNLRDWQVKMLLKYVDDLLLKGQFENYQKLFCKLEAEKPEIVTFFALKPNPKFDYTLLIQWWLAEDLSADFFSTDDFIYFLNAKGLKNLSRETHYEVLTRMEMVERDSLIAYFKKNVLPDALICTFAEFEEIILPYENTYYYTEYINILLIKCSSYTLLELYFNDWAEIEIVTLVEYFDDLNAEEKIRALHRLQLKDPLKCWGVFQNIQIDIPIFEDKETLDAFYQPFQESLYAADYYEFATNNIPQDLKITLWQEGKVELNDNSIKEALADENYRALVMDKISFIRFIKLVNFQVVAYTNDLMKLLIRELSNELSCFTFDLEYRRERLTEWTFSMIKNGQKYYESAYQWNDRFEQAFKQGEVYIGHNILAYDLPKVEVDLELKIEREAAWDTLLLQAFLSPERTSLALQTTHESLKDVQLTERLFQLQLLHCLLLEDHSFQLISSYLHPYVLIFLEEKRGQIRGTKVFSVELLNPFYDEIFKISTPNPYCVALSKALKETTASTVIIQSPQKLMYCWQEMEEIEILSSDIIERTMTVDEALLSDVLTTDARYWGVCLQHFVERCKEKATIPRFHRLSPYIKSQVLQVMDITNICSVEPLHLRLKGNWVATTATLVKLQDMLPKNESVDWLLVEPKLLQLTEQSRLHTFNYEELTNIDGLKLVWKNFNGAESFASIQKKLLLNHIREEHLSQFKKVWIQKENYDVYHIWGSRNMNIAKAFKPLTNEELNIAVKSQHRPFIIKSNSRNLAELDIIRLNPNTLSKDRYWVLQFMLVRQIIEKYDDRSTIWLIDAKTSDIKKLIDYFNSKNFYIPNQQASLSRQLELLDSSMQLSKIGIFNIDKFENIMPSITNAFNVVIDSFRVGEIWYRYGEEAIVQEIGRTTKENEKISSEEISFDDTENEEEIIGGNAPKLPIRNDTGGLLELLNPLVEHYNFLVERQNNESQLFLIDPKLEDYAGHLARVWKAKVMTESLWANRIEYESDLKQMQQFFSPKRRNANLQIDIEKGKIQIRELFIGGSDFYDDQKPYINKILPAKTDLMVTLPTGGGKSILFQGPALYRSSLTGGLSLVITPLKALMEDQVYELWEKGFWNCVDYINADKGSEVQDIYRRIAGGELNMVYITPERFRSRSFIRALNMRLEIDKGLEYLIFDEAHCISHWGNEFRPDYYYAAQKSWAIKQGAKIPFPLLLFSATVSEQIFDDFNLIFS